VAPVATLENPAVDVLPPVEIVDVPPDSVDPPVPTEPADEPPES
jgi:hypothetical protein